jgi:hypothetical protein
MAHGFVFQVRPEMSASVAEPDPVPEIALLAAQQFFTPQRPNVINGSFQAPNAPKKEVVDPDLRRCKHCGKMLHKNSLWKHEKKDCPAMKQR